MAAAVSGGCAGGAGDRQVSQWPSTWRTHRRDLRQRVRDSRLGSAPAGGVSSTAARGRLSLGRCSWGYGYPSSRPRGDITSVASRSNGCLDHRRCRCDGGAGVAGNPWLVGELLSGVARSALLSCGGARSALLLSRAVKERKPNGPSAGCGSFCRYLAPRAYHRPLSRLCTRRRRPHWMRPSAPWPKGLEEQHLSGWDKAVRAQPRKW